MTCLKGRPSTQSPVEFNVPHWKRCCLLLNSHRSDAFFAAQLSGDKMKHLTRLRYVDAIARIASIRGAADSLSITTIALNRRILALEEELGVAIFGRLPRGVRLSSAGGILVHHIRSQLSDMEVSGSDCRVTVSALGPATFKPHV